MLFVNWKIERKSDKSTVKTLCVGSVFVFFMTKYIFPPGLLDITLNCIVSPLENPPPGGELSGSHRNPH